MNPAIPAATALILLTLHASPPVEAAGGRGIHHAFHWELGGGRASNGATNTESDLDGWIGGDYHKLAIKSEAERENGVTGRAEFWAMYSRNIATFWDLQIGIRHDTQPGSLTRLVLGSEGLAPYFFETEAHILISDNLAVSARLRQENDFLLTQRAVMQLYLDAELHTRDIPELEAGAGLSDAEAGLQIRYELSRDFAPYFDIRYERKFGETSAIARRNGEENDAVIAMLGLRLLF